MSLSKSHLALLGRSANPVARRDAEPVQPAQQFSRISQRDGAATPDAAWRALFTNIGKREGT